MMSELLLKNCFYFYFLGQFNYKFYAVQYDDADNCSAAELLIYKGFVCLLNVTITMTFFWLAVCCFMLQIQTKHAFVYVATYFKCTLRHYCVSFFVAFKENLQN